MNKDIKFVCDVDLSKIEQTKNTALLTDWTDSYFDRNEVTLKSGRLCTLPYAVRNKKQQTYSKSQEKLIESAMPVVNIVLSHFSDLYLVRGEIVNLFPGKSLIPHIDIYWFHKHSRRIHIPIYTNDFCFQIFENREYHLEVGSAYEINNRIKHSARNDGTTDRIHIILDLMSKEYIKQMMKDPTLALQEAG